MQLWLRVITVFAMLWRHRKKRSRSTRNLREVAQAKRASTEKVTVKFHFQVDWVCSHCWARLCEHLLGKSVWASSERFKWGRETLLWPMVSVCFFYFAFASESTSWGDNLFFLVYFWASYKHVHTKIPRAYECTYLHRKGDIADVCRFKDLDIMRWSWLSWWPWYKSL